MADNKKIGFRSAGCFCAAVVVTMIAACGGGGGNPTTPTPVATATPSDPQASGDTIAVEKYLAALTNGSIPGVIAGQNTGHGNQITQPDGLVGYASLITPLQQTTGQAPAIVGLDYEQDLIFTPEQLADANQTLIAHWAQGGLVTVNWSPQNPWLNDESDLADNPGVWTNTRTIGNNMAGVDLRQLIDPTSAIYPVWRRKLDRIATALQGLQAAGVVVLWRPMQEMNGNWFWWGTSTHAQDPAPYAALWQDMFRYFTQEKGLHNLLWVYSPVSGPHPVPADGSVHDVLWAYPGAAYVDVVAGTAYNDALSIDDYDAYVSLAKPVGMGELGPQLGGAASWNGTFDNWLYHHLIDDYPAIAYWVSWHDYPVDGGHVEHPALVSQQNAARLLQAPDVLTVARVNWKAFR